MTTAFWDPENCSCCLRRRMTRQFEIFVPKIWNDVNVHCSHCRFSLGKSYHWHKLLCCRKAEGKKKTFKLKAFAEVHRAANWAQLWWNVKRASFQKRFWCFWKVIKRNHGCAANEAMERSTSKLFFVFVLLLCHIHLEGVVNVFQQFFFRIQKRRLEVKCSRRVFDLSFVKLIFNHV